MRVHPAIHVHIWLICSGVSLAGCFFTDEINSPPQAQIELLQEGDLYRGMTLDFSARKSDDPNGDVLEVDWSAYTCSADRTVCDTPAHKRMSDASLDSVFEFEVPDRRIGVDEPVVTMVVEAEVSDARGAVHTDRAFVNISNRMPEVVLQGYGASPPGQSGYPLGTSVRILADGSDPEGDAVTYEWSLEPASGSTPGAFTWSMIDQDEYELTPDVDGLWTVRVTVTDELEDATTEDISLDIQPDQVPCLRLTEPQYVEGARYIVDRDDVSRRFAVLSVRDDLDSYPPEGGDAFTDQFFGSAAFRWYLATPDTAGELVEVVGHDVADYLLDVSAYAPGDHITLRVEIDDRVGRDIICGSESPICSLTGDEACQQRLTWNLEVR